MENGKDKDVGRSAAQILWAVCRKQVTVQGEVEMILSFSNVRNKRLQKQQKDFRLQKGSPTQ